MSHLVIGVVQYCGNVIMMLPPGTHGIEYGQYSAEFWDSFAGAKNGCNAPFSDALLHDDGIDDGFRLLIINNYTVDFLDPELAHSAFGRALEGAAQSLWPCLATK